MFDNPAIIRIKYFNYQNNTIWRCYYNKEKNQWEPRELRKDKKKANPYYLFLQLTLDHRSRWTPMDIPRINSWYQKYTKKPSKKNAEVDHNNILNLGSGYRKKGSINCDIDLATLEKNDLLLNMDIPWDTCSQSKYFGKIWHRVNLLELSPMERTFEEIHMNLCLNQLKTDIWIKELEKRSCKGTILQVTFLDYDKLPNERITSSTGFIEKHSNKVQVMIFNTHRESIFEAKVSGEELINKLTTWRLKKKSLPKIYNSFKEYYTEMIFEKQSTHANQACQCRNKIST